MRFTSKQYAQALHQAISESTPADQEKILDNFAQILRQNGDLSKIAEIEKEFLSVSGIKQALVTSARDLNPSEEKKIIEELNQYTKAKVEIKKKVDEGLVGGVVIKIDDELLDGSVKRSLIDLKHKLLT